MPERRRGSPILRLVAPKAPIFASLSLQLSRYRPYTYFTPRHATRLLQLIKSNTPVPPLPSATIEPERAKKISAATITFHPSPFDAFDPNVRVGGISYWRLYLLAFTQASSIDVSANS